ncbi:unnamed protein product [Paramecium sonneborni]|uniref:Uncharacterized protein n=1 Tax=Paramecium sonneborni TaxID=65129 RepID=A0A8S1QPX1_9CILI|nr:unnamed protein product [Paramecium sonneborni]
MNKNPKFIWYLNNGKQRAQNKYQVFLQSTKIQNRQKQQYQFWTPN